MYMIAHYMYMIAHLVFWGLFASCEAETRTGFGVQSGDVLEQLQNLQNMYADLKEEMHLMRIEKISQANHLNSLSKELNDIQEDNEKLRKKYDELKVEQDTTKKYLNDMQIKYEYLERMTDTSTKVDGIRQKFDTSLHQKKEDNREQTQIRDTKEETFEDYLTENEYNHLTFRKAIGFEYRDVDKENTSSIPKPERRSEYAAKEENPIGFTATLQHSISNSYFRTVIDFDVVSLNNGNGYDPNTGLFTCPYPGMYAFYVTVATGNSGWFSGAIAHNGQNVANIYMSNFSYYGSSMALVSLKKDDAVFVWSYGVYPNGEIIGNYMPAFSGFLIK